MNKYLINNDFINLFINIILIFGKLFSFISSITIKQNTQ